MARPEDDRRCPRCGTPYSDGQEYCLECGRGCLRVPARSPGSARRWRRRAGWYPGDWIWPALLALVVAIVAGVVSAVWLADDSSSANDTLVRTQAGPSASVPTQTAPEPTTSTSPTTTAHGHDGAPTSPAPEAHARRVARRQERLDDRARLGADDQRPAQARSARPSRRCASA